MSSRNIAVQKDVYDALRRERRAGESFTQVIQRALARRGGIEEVFGAWGSQSIDTGLSTARRLRNGAGRGGRR